MDFRQGIIKRFMGQYGFIAENGTNREIFYHLSGIRPDSRGSLAHAFEIGSRVTFRVEHKDGKARAVDVVGQWLFNEQVDLETYRGVSQILQLKQRHGFVVRVCGSQLFFSTDFILPAYRDRLDELKLGDFIYLGICRPDGRRWVADRIEIYSREDQDRLQRGEPLEPIEDDADNEVPEANSTVDILSPTKRNKTILELIQSKQAKAKGASQNAVTLLPGPITGGMELFSYVKHSRCRFLHVNRQRRL